MPIILPDPETTITFKTLQDRVILNRFDDTTYRPLVKDWLNDGMRLVHRRLHLQADDAVQTLVTTSGLASYNLNSHLRVSVVYITDGNDASVIEQGDLEDLARVLTGTTGRPEFWVLTAGQIVFGPTPDAAYPVSIDYASPAVRMIGDADLPALADEYTHLLESYAIAEGWRREEDWEAATQWDQVFETRLVRAGVDLQHPGDMEGAQLQGGW